jgi:hypothetical protein
MELAKRLGVGLPMPLASCWARIIQLFPCLPICDGPLENGWLWVAVNNPEPLRVENEEHST